MKLKLKKLKSNFTFNKKIAKGFTKIAYYQAQARNMAMYEFLESEKQRLATPKLEYITNLINMYKNLGDEGWESPTGKILIGIFKKNSQAVKTGQNAINTKLIDLIAKPEILLLAYRAIKGNKGALTEAAGISEEKFFSLTPEQKDLYVSSYSFPDKFNLKDVFTAGRLIKKGLYPWGSSRRVYVDKPGVKNKKRPITIPPFLDRVVQKAISMILEAIYEPYFEDQNRSFGFRPNKGVHDAIVALTSTKSSGKIIAIEGDIEAAYDTVNKDKLINILSEKIKDRKFLKLIRDRLDYDYVERTEDGYRRVKPILGIPQGGIDSPYLFNIYMKKLDDYILTDIKDYIDKLNERMGDKRYVSHFYSKLKNKRTTTINRQKRVKTDLKNIKDPSLLEKKKNELFRLIKEKRIIEHKIRQVRSTDYNKLILNLLYVRYADDWIIVTRGNMQLAKIIKEKIANFLDQNLGLKLSENKTTITDIRKRPAKFLGFQLKHTDRGPLVKKPLKNVTDTTYKKTNLQRSAGTIIWAAPDAQRLINRMHMKGFCTKTGFPRELPWLSCMEPHVIVERYNAVIRGFAEFYLGFVRDKSSISRWIYIYRYSCLKTLAQKYNTTINGIFKKFGHNLTITSRKTIKITVALKFNDETYTKDWILWTYKDLLKIVKGTRRKKALKDRFWSIEDKEIVSYPMKSGKFPAVTNDNYMDAVSWVSLRTQASLNMPCAHCGTFDNVHQHHIKHIRKRAYSLIPDEVSYKKL